MRYNEGGALVAIGRILLPKTKYMNPKLDALRAAMQAAGVDAYLIPNTDPHQSEYFADHYMSIAWLSGFTGSNAMIAVTQDFAGLWTDGRYYLQASQQLQGSGFEMMKLEGAAQPEYLTWLAQQLPASGRVGIDGRLFSIAQVKGMQRAFKKKNIVIEDGLDLVADSWTDRPAVNATPIYIHEVKYAGKSRVEKLADIRAEMKAREVTHYLITALDDIGWTFNIRGNDVNYNPVTYAFALVSLTEAHLMIDASKVSDEIKAELEADGVQLQPYDATATMLEHIAAGTILLSAGQTNVALYKAILADVQVEMGDSIAQHLKGIKNATEQEWLRRCMVKDGVAMVRFLKWLEDNIGKTAITELSAADKLHDFRAQQELFVGDSFPAISGYKGNGAIIHYKVSPASDTALQPDGLYLIDSGGQYLDGTTDITRTVTLGNVTDEERKMYTLVLKGHIGMAALVFPEGTRGNQIDVMARQPLWQHGLNYRHGTGHGVGFFMNVHEGPQRIAHIAGGSADLPIKEGMYSSNEPGFYEEGKFGIRIENLVLTQKAVATDYGQYYRFETITLCPLEPKLVDSAMLTESEREWYNAYQAEVLAKLSPALNAEEQSWLAEKCQPI